MSNSKILQDFESNQLTYKAFEIKMLHLISDLLASKNLQVHNIATRVKDRDSLEKKLPSKTNINISSK